MGCRGQRRWRCGVSVCTVCCPWYETGMWGAWFRHGLHIICRPPPSVSCSCYVDRPACAKTGPSLTGLTLLYDLSFSFSLPRPRFCDPSTSEEYTANPPTKAQNRDSGTPDANSTPPRPKEGMKGRLFRVQETRAHNTRGCAFYFGAVTTPSYSRELM